MSGWRSGTKTATERTAVVAVAVARRADIGVIKPEAARVGRIRVGATRPVVGVVAGVVQLTITVDVPATYKTRRLETETTLRSGEAIASAKSV